MIEEQIVSLVKDLGFPIFIAVVLLWDKIKTNGSLVKIVENNNHLLNEIKELIKK